MKRHGFALAGLIAAGALAFALSGCAAKKKPEAAPPPPPTPPPLSISVDVTPPKPTPTPTPVPTPPPAPPAPSPCEVLHDALAPLRVPFDHDRSNLDRQAVAVVSQIADAIRASKIGPALDIEVQGYCDETGSDAYNIALGDRRATSVKRRLVDLGVVNPDHVKTVSFGEERPLDPAHTPEAYAKNRRVEVHVSCP